MPLTSSAKKKMRHDKTVTVRNDEIRKNLKGLIKNTRREASAEKLSKAFKALDKAAKIHLIHKNTASRLKSRLAKLQASVK